MNAEPWHQPITIEVDADERVMLICAVLRWAGEMAHPERAIALLDKISPHPSASWEEPVARFREQVAQLREGDQP